MLRLSAKPDYFERLRRYHLTSRSELAIHLAGSSFRRENRVLLDLVGMSREFLAENSRQIRVV